MNCGLDGIRKQVAQGWAPVGRTSRLTRTAALLSCPGLVTGMTGTEGCSNVP